MTTIKCTVPQKISVPHDVVEDRINYHFKNHPQLLDQAFVRRSYAADNNEPDSEALEFFGDAVLEFFASKNLMLKNGEINEDRSDRNFGTYSLYNKRNEGTLTKLRINRINNDNLAACIDQLKLAKYITFGNTELETMNPLHMTKAKADLFEAIVGAIALDCENDYASLENAVSHMMGYDSDIKEEPETNYSESIQAWHQKEYGTTPDYFYDKFFNEIRCHLELPVIETSSAGGKKIYFAAGNTRKEARENLAEQIYYKLEEYGRLHSLRDEFKQNEITLDNAINKLQELYQKGGCSEPEYTTSDDNEFDEDGHFIWWCSCKIFDLTNGKYNERGKNLPLMRAYPAGGQDIETYYWQGNSKKTAKKYAAYDALCQFFGWENEFDDTDE